MLDRFFNLSEDSLKELRYKTQIGELDYHFWCDFFGNVLNEYSTTRYDLNPFQVYRARINWDNITKEKIEFFRNVNKLGAPEDSCIKSLGRCNAINESVFYCSGDPITTLFEIRPEEDMEFTILDYKCNGKLLNLNVIGVEVLSELNRDLGALLKKHYDYDGVLTDYISKLKIIDSFLAKEFQTVIDKKTYSYHVTNGITKFYWRENTHEIGDSKYFLPSNGLVYPSVALRQSGINYALKKNYYKSVLIPSMAYKIVVVRKRGDFDYDIQMLNNSSEITNTGEIIWQSNVGPVERITDTW